MDLMEWSNWMNVHIDNSVVEIFSQWEDMIWDDMPPLIKTALHQLQDIKEAV